MADAEDYVDDALPGSGHAEKRLARDQPESTPDEMLSDYDGRLARRIAREISKTGGIDSTAEHRADHEWVRTLRRRCEWWSETGRTTLREVIRWLILGVLGLIAAGAWIAFRATILGEP